MDVPTLTLSADQVLLPGSLHILETKVLPAYIPRQRWFGGKARNPQQFEILELIELAGGTTSCALLLVRVGYADGSDETYTLPVEARSGDAVTERVLAKLADETVLADAIEGESFRVALIRLIASGSSWTVPGGSLAGVRGRGLPAEADAYQSRVLRVEQSNSSIIYSDEGGSDRLFVKLFRKLEDGRNPDVEITQELSERQRFSHVPAFGGSLEYRRTGAAEPQVLALALGMIPNYGDAWSFTLHEVAKFYTEVRKTSETPPAATALFSGGEESRVVLDLLGSYAARARQLGVRTGQLHLALEAADSNPAFSPEPLNQDDLEELAEGIRTSADRVSGLLKSAGASLPSELIAATGDLQGAVAKRATGLSSAAIAATKIRTHGDYHLGQVLNTGDDFVIIDFEGEPLRPLRERKAKRSPLRDVAGMVRSFHYAAHSGLSNAPDRDRMLAWAESWAGAISRIFLAGWRETVGAASFVPPEPAAFATLLEAFLLEKALYEVTYELNNRPTWVGIPLSGVRSVLGY
jgi:maltose alpha-D-glucosyltransferase/alpha-amylase